MYDPISYGYVTVFGWAFNWYTRIREDDIVL